MHNILSFNEYRRFANTNAFGVVCLCVYIVFVHFFYSLKMGFYKSKTCIFKLRLYISESKKAGKSYLGNGLVYIKEFYCVILFFKC